MCCDVEVCFRLNVLLRPHLLSVGAVQLHGTEQAQYAIDEIFTWSFDGCQTAGWPRHVLAATATTAVGETDSANQLAVLQVQPRIGNHTLKLVTGW